MRKRAIISLNLLLAPVMAWGQIIIIGGGGGGTGGGFPPGNSAPVQPVLQAVIVDALGRQVGATTPYPYATFVTIAVNGRVVLTQVVKNGLLGYPPNLYFQSSNCSGPTYIQPDDPNAFVQFAAIGPPGKSLYAPRAGAALQLTTVRSQLFQMMNGQQICVLPPAGPGGAEAAYSLVPADPTVDLNQYFLPPFTLRTQ